MRVLDIFKEITAIPHCSGATQALHDYIVAFAKKTGFTSEVDVAGNILCYKTKRHICVQSHYDMVCVGQAPAIELINDGEFLRAKDSSLGADNGIGVAIMLALMEEGIEAEYLFTNDEEIGLVGAKNLQLQLRAKAMLNLDSEEFGAIYVGCAGGVDMHAERSVRFVEAKSSHFYRITARNFPGGHSGVDIHKNIPSAIKEFAHFAKGAKVAAIEAGERHNSIPVHLSAIVATDQKLMSNEHFIVEKAEPRPVIDYDIVSTLCAFSQGVRGWDEEFGIPERSANLAKVLLDGETLHIDVSLRANSDEALERLKEESSCFWQRDFALHYSGEYPAWKPHISDLARNVAKLYEKYVPNPAFKAIHAGLECAVFAHAIPQIASIGPDIIAPHSVHERVRIATIEPIYAIVKALLCEA